jgi:hypothetical protein
MAVFMGNKRTIDALKQIEADQIQIAISEPESESESTHVEIVVSSEPESSDAQLIAEIIEEKHQRTEACSAKSLSFSDKPPEYIPRGAVASLCTSLMSSPRSEYIMGDSVFSEVIDNYYFIIKTIKKR